MVQKARDLSAGGVWFLSVRVAEVGVLVLLVGGLLDVRNAWEVGAQYVGGTDAEGNVVAVTLMQRITGFVLFGGYRAPTSMLVTVLALAGLLTILHRCQPVSHTRVLRWEWLTLWAVGVLLSFTVSAASIVALFADDPFPQDEPGAVPRVGPGFHEQILGSLTWPLAALLLILPLGLWWARLPDMDDLEDALAEAEAQRLEAGDPPSPVATGQQGAGGPTVSAAPASGGVTRPARGRRVTGERPAGRGRGADDDSIFVDGVEQIEPVERLTPRGSDRGDGSSSSGYDGYFHRQ